MGLEYTFTRFTTVGKYVSPGLGMAIGTCLGWSWEIDPGKPFTRKPIEADPLVK